jgi:hypothetical protein
MPPPLPQGVTVTFYPRISSTATDAHGQAIPAFGPPAVAEGCAVAPGAQTEIADPEREGVTIALTVYATYPPAVGPLDEADVDGWPGRFQVVGEPARWRSPYSDRPPGQVVELKRVDG